MPITALKPQPKKTPRMDDLEELTSAWVRWLRHKDAISMSALIQKADELFASDEQLRRSELKRVQRSFYRVAIANKLLESKGFSSESKWNVLVAVDKIIEKRRYVSGQPATNDIRSREEERMYGAARVRWSKLLKKAQVRAADPRGGDTRRFRFVYIQDPKGSPARG